MLLKAFIFSLSLFSVSTLLSQSVEMKALSVVGLNGITIEHQKVVQDREEALGVKNQILQQLYTQAYLAASFDSIKVNKKKIMLFFSSGKVYQWMELRSGNIPSLVRSEADVNGRLYFNRPFNQKQLQTLFKRIIQYYENNGHPFAAVNLDSVKIINNQKISAALNIKKGKYFQFDSLEVVGDIEVSEQFILNSLGLEKGSAYHEDKMKNISTNIREIPFLEKTREHEVQFFEESVKLILYLKKKNASSFNGVLGLMTNEDDGKVEITGDVDLKLLNSFNRGEKISLQWQKLNKNSQELNIDFGIPYLFNTSFGFDFNFQLYKQDTTFLDLESRFGINYIFNGQERIHLFVENRRSSLLSKSQFVSNSSEIPPYADLKINQFGLSYQLQKLDYRFNPQKGFVLEPTFAVGRKKLEKIAALEEQQPQIYEDVKTKNIQYDAELHLKYFVQIGKRGTILIGNHTATTYSDVLYTNELMRIGGLKTLRGFDAESIRASSFSIFTLEYRFLLDRNSYLSIFSDGGIYEKNDIQNYVQDTPVGFGAGINFETNAGIFSFNYAVGKQFDNPIEFQAAKIHFGYTNLF